MHLDTHCRNNLLCVERNRNDVSRKTKSSYSLNGGSKSLTICHFKNPVLGLIFGTMETTKNTCELYETAC